MVRLVADQLGDAGYQVELAGSGKEALAVAAVRPPVSLLKKSQFFRPMATPRKAFSAMLLSISTQPLLQYTFRASRYCSRYANAFAVSE